MSNNAAMKSPPSQRHAVVTGASAGIGRAIAELLLESGWRVTGVDRDPPTLATDHFNAFTVDLSIGTEVERIAQQLVDADALVHAAGILRVGRIGELDHVASDLMWRLHVDAANRLCNTIMPAMAARYHGRVVFIGSRVSQGMPGRGQYAATKAALIAMSRSWAAEFAEHGVTVNVVSPAATATGMLNDPARSESAARVPPIDRLIEPVEVAQLIGYLLSPAAAAITGQNIGICGGASLRC